MTLSAQPWHPVSQERCAIKRNLQDEQALHQSFTLNLLSLFCVTPPLSALITSLLGKRCSYTPNHPKPHMTKVSFATKLKPPQFTLLWSFNYIDPWHYQVCILSLLAGRPSWWPEGVWLYLCTYLHSTLFFITKRQLDGMPKFTKRWNPRKSESKTVPKEGKRHLQCSSRNSNSLISAFPSSTQTYNHNSREEKKST